MTKTSNPHRQDWTPLRIWFNNIGVTLLLAVVLGAIASYFLAGYAVQQRWLIAVGVSMIILMFASFLIESKQIFPGKNAWVRLFYTFTFKRPNA